MSVQNIAEQLRDAKKSAPALSLEIERPTITPAAPLQRSAADTDAWIFRDGRNTVASQKLLRYISDGLSNLKSDSLTDALIVAGELETGVSDAGHYATAEAVAITDAIANALCTSEPKYFVEAHQLLESVHVPEQISISPPEGFTYYALHPLDFAHVTSQFPAEITSFAVIGIRSIGATLSAVVMASLKNDGRRASRITVRPKGHPYSRKMTFSIEEEKWIHQHSVSGAHFVIVDEGPGRSGSTFLSVAEALLTSGIRHERITLLGSREPDPDQLLAEDAANRWAQFRFIVPASSVNTRFADHIYVGGGFWRKTLLNASQIWPESWTQMERLKFITADRQKLFKFEGMGRIGVAARHRAFALAEAGFSPPAFDVGGGFLAYRVISCAETLQATDLNSCLLELMGRYCAFRASNFQATGEVSSELRQMVEFNVLQEFGIALSLSEDTFATSNSVIVDGRMQPYEWIAAGPNKFFKTDAISHGDDHFFPGPGDITWDLAGIVIEWKLGRREIRDLIVTFERASGMERIADHLPMYMLAYSIFRAGFCKMGSGTVCDPEEQARLRLAYLRYRAIAQDLLREILS